MEKTPPARAIRPDVRVRLIGEAPFFGPGTAQLLDGIARRGSVYQACQALGLSYSKGRGMLRNLERQLGTPAAVCAKGGAGGGGARLTQAGERILADFVRYEADVRQYAQSRFTDYFPAAQ